MLGFRKSGHIWCFCYDFIVGDFNCGSKLLISFDYGLHCNDKSFYNKLWSIHTNDVFIPKNHTHATVIFITMVKTFMKKAYTQMMLDIDFHWFHCSRRHSPDTTLDFLQIFVMQKKQLISCTSILRLCFLYRISSVLLLLSSFPKHNPLSSSNFCNTRISILSVTLSSLDCGSCILLCN